MNLFQDSGKVSIPYFLWKKVYQDSKQFILLLTPVSSPSPLVTFPTKKYNTKHNIIHLKRHTEEFCGKTGIQSCLSNTKYNKDTH
jgi:hypothetical protein